MEEELRCPVCKHLFCNAILLPCFHSICLNCALNLQQTINLNNNNVSQCNMTSPSSATAANVGNNNICTHVVTATIHQSADETPLNSNIVSNSVGDFSSHSMSTTSSSAGSEMSDSDKLSLLSETDSGVVVCNSRPNSYVGTPNLQATLFAPQFQNAVSLNAIPLNAISLNAISLSCPVCHKVVYLDENGAHNLPKNKTLQNIVDKFGESISLRTLCQLCEADPKEANIMCEQCEIFYCDACRENCHPLRGPLAKHSLIAPQQGKMNLQKRTRNKDSVPKCSDHMENPLSSFCMLCKIPICNTCIQESRHSSHEIQALGVVCKTQKVRIRIIRIPIIRIRIRTRIRIIRINAANDRLYSNHDRIT